MLTNPGDLNELTHDIIGSAIQVHRELGPGLLEGTYSVCLTAELRSRGHSVDRNVAIAIVYREVKIDNAYRIDMVVDGRVVVELKSVDKLHPVHRAQMLTYLRLAGHPVGLLINFNEQVLRDGIKRVLNSKSLIEGDPQQKP